LKPTAKFTPSLRDEERVHFGLKPTAKFTPSLRDGERVHFVQKFG